MITPLILGSIDHSAMKNIDYRAACTTLTPSPLPSRPAQLSVRGRNRKERLEGLMKSFSKTTDELLLQATQRDVDEFFDHEKSYVLVFHEHIKEATQRADRMTRCRKSE